MLSFQLSIFPMANGDNIREGARRCPPLYLFYLKYNVQENELLSHIRKESKSAQLNSRQSSEKKQDPLKIVLSCRVAYCKKILLFFSN